MSRRTRVADRARRDNFTVRQLQAFVFVEGTGFDHVAVLGGRENAAG
jgi:hypothetical protein